ncbi:imidazole glycerol phosphate synthase subunit HisF [Candidatus Gracilibacteria bacterium]|nr:imidazole glycerol phosphate synthase subunit HisF [Candidatus Gracilibacteria bacterium]
MKTTLTKRIIPCLDIKDGRVVKGTNFVSLVDAGDPVVIAERYSQEGADEIIILDIQATVDAVEPFYKLIEKIAAKINIPLTVGGGIKNIEDIRRLLRSGADKVSIGSAAVKNPALVSEASQEFGSQCIVVSVDPKKCSTNWEIYVKGGREATGIDMLTFVKDMEQRGAGELLVNSIDRDGTSIGYDIDLLKAVTAAVHLPVIASSGAGKMEDFVEVFKKTNVGAALAARIFHTGLVEIPKLKEFLAKNNIAVRR